MDGWIKLHRKISENPLWTSEPFSRGQAFVDLILLASHKDSFFYKRGVKVVVKRGQLAWGEISLSQRWKWSRNKLRKFLNDLKKVQQIEQQKSQVITVITIVNYDMYQEKGTTDDTTEGTTEGQQTIQQKVQQKDTYKNDKNVKTVKKEKNVKNEDNPLGVIFPFESENFKNQWFNWKEYKKNEHGFKYKSKQSQQGALKKLSKLSDGNEEEAIEIIHQSIENGWKGFFQLEKNNQNGQQKGNGYNDKGQVQYSEDYKRRIFEKIQSG